MRGCRWVRVSVNVRVRNEIRGGGKEGIRKSRVRVGVRVWVRNRIRETTRN